MMSKTTVEEAMSVSVGMHTGKRSRKFEEEGEHLLPGIPDELTLNHITSKLPWRAIHILQLLNSSWRRAVQTRKVHDARVRSHSTETLVIIDHKAGPLKFIALYSIRDKCCYFLPSIPHVDGGIPLSCQSTSLDGKIYILGGGKRQCATSEVYVLDLVGHRQWKRCASMQEPRRSFGCGVISGKIYVFGGFSNGPVRGSEVYDPMVDAWSVIMPIMPMMRLRWDHDVVRMGEEFFVYGGQFYDSDDFEGVENTEIEPDRIHEAYFLEVYHPVKDNWRLEESFGCSMQRSVVPERLFVAKGRIYSMTNCNIRVYDMGTKSWTHQHVHSFCAALRLTSDEIGTVRFSVLAVKDELLAKVHCSKRGSPAAIGPCLLQSRGFGSVHGLISWEMVHSSLSFGYFPFMYPVQL